jgi:hypothetical protein
MFSARVRHQYGRARHARGPSVIFCHPGSAGARAQPASAQLRSQYPANRSYLCAKCSALCLTVLGVGRREHNDHPATVQGHLGLTPQGQTTGPLSRETTQARGCYLPQDTNGR